VVTDLHKFDFRFVINETRSKWRPVERFACGDEKHIFLTGFRFTPLFVAGVKRIYPRYAGQLHSLERETLNKI